MTLPKVSAYTYEQVDHYLERIQIPSCFRRCASPKPDLEFLKAIQKHHLSHIPFEGLQLHYHSERKIDLDPQKIYEKFIVRRHGGYCMEQNSFLSHILLALGFNLYTTGARVQKRIDGIPSGSWHGWSHQVILVKLAEGTCYVVDVGFGGDGAVEPLLLQENVITPNLGRQEKRMSRESLSFLTDPAQKSWVYQVRNGPDKPWNSCYAFAEIEFGRPDYEVMSLYASIHPESYLTVTCVAVKMLLKDDEVYGKLMLHGADLKRNTGGRTELLQTCKSEAERLEVLDKHFGIIFSEAERNAIKGTRGEIQDPTTYPKS